MLSRNAIAILMGLFSFTLASAHSRGEDKQAPVLELSLGQGASRALTNIIDVGPVEENKSAQLEINVRNISSKSVTLDSFASGNNLSSEWDSPEETTGLKTRAIIGVNDTKRLLLAIQFTNSDSARVDLMVQGREMATLLVVYQIMAPLYCRGIQELGLPSAYGGGYYPDESHPYTFCTLPPLPGYEIDPSSIIFTVKTNQVSSHDRGCDGTAQGVNSHAFTECKKTSSEKGDICFTLRIQGHHKDGGLGKSTENQTVYVNARLQANYRLVSPTTPNRPFPRLLSSERLESIPKATPLASEKGEVLSLSPNCHWGPNNF
jgi:hypothetical protein